MRTNKKGQVGAIVGVVFVFLAILIVCLLGFDQVNANQQGVMDQFGVVRGVMQPGIRWTGMFTHVTAYPLSVQKMLLAKVRAVDNTGQDVFADIAINYKIKQSPDCPQNPNACIPLRLYKEVGPNGDMQWVEQQLAIPEKIQEGLKQITVKYEALEILNKRDEVRELAVARITELFPKDYFEILSITVTNIGYQPSFEAAIQLKKDNTQLAKASEEAVKKAGFEADSVIQTARGAAESVKLNAEADAYKKKTMAEAEAFQSRVMGEANAYSLKLRRQEITPMLVQSQWIEKWSGNVPTMMMGKGQGVFLQMPVDTVMK